VKRSGVAVGTGFAALAAAARDNPDSKLTGLTKEKPGGSGNRGGARMTLTIALPLVAAQVDGASVYVTGTGGQGVSGAGNAFDLSDMGQIGGFSSAPGGAHPVTGHAQIPRTDARL